MNPGTRTTGSSPCSGAREAYGVSRRCSRSRAERRTNRAASLTALPSRAIARRPDGPAYPGGHRNDPIGESMSVTVTT